MALYPDDSNVQISNLSGDNYQKVERPFEGDDGPPILG